MPDEWDQPRHLLHVAAVEVIELTGVVRREERSAGHAKAVPSRGVENDAALVEPDLPHTVEAEWFVSHRDFPFSHASS